MKDDEHYKYIYNYIYVYLYALLIYYWPEKIKRNGDLQFNTEIKEIDIDIDLVISTWKDAVDTINSPSCPKTISCEEKWCEHA